MGLNKNKLLAQSPGLVKRALVNLESLYRDYFRRWGDYDALVEHHNLAYLKQPEDIQRAYQTQRLATLTDYARRHVPYYRDHLPDIPIKTLDDLQSLPILERIVRRDDPDAFINPAVPSYARWEGRTSGSTGTPLRYMLGREAVREQTAAYHGLMAYYGCSFSEVKVRIAGATVIPPDRLKPPFWVYIDRYHQWLFSLHNLGPQTYRQYLKAMYKANAAFGSGYAGAWRLLTRLALDNGDTAPKLRRIFTDAEGLSPGEQDDIEKLFSARVHQTYGTAEVGMTAVQCEHRNYHVLSRSKIVEILDDNRQPVAPGESGQIFITDLTNHNAPFIRYGTGDIGTLAENSCPCGLQGMTLSRIVGRLDDYIVTPDGRMLTRLDFVLKVDYGVKESQLVQKSPDTLVIRLVPSKDYNDELQQRIIDNARSYMGPKMQISVELTDRLPRTAGGKVRYVVREFR